MTGPVYFFGVSSSGLPPARRIALFLDFDGTLAPIRKDPALCEISPETRRLLQSLAKSKNQKSGRLFIMVLSGRALDDVSSRVGIRNICYGGNHGLAIKGRGLKFVHPDAASALPAIEEAAFRLERETAGFEGAWVERKKYSLSLHYRMADKRAVPRLRRIFDGVAAGFSMDKDKKLLATATGKKVLELKPASWDKGQAVLWVLGRLKGEYLPVFAGDDETDETAFRALKDTGVTVRLGRSKSTLANFYLKGRWEVCRLLEAVLAWPD